MERRVGAGTAPPCPPRPSSTHPSHLGFVRRPMVRWLDPHQLVDTAVRVLVSGIFSAYADKREVQALEPADVTASNSSNSASTAR